MKKRGNRIAILAVLFLTLSASIVDAGFTVLKARAQPMGGLATLEMSPSYLAVQNVASPFSLDITISNITDLYAWQVTIYFPNTVLNVVGATQGDFLNSVNSTYWIPTWNNSYNSTTGMVVLYCTLESQISGVNGTGTLATLTFQAVGSGNATLHFDSSNTQFLNSTLPWHDPIPYTAIDGIVNTPQFVAVTGVTPLKTVVGQGFTFNVSVTFANPGTYAETFSANIYLNSTMVTNQTLTMPSGTVSNITFVVPTSSLDKGNYSLSASADNTYVDGVVKVTIPGDIDGNYWVQLADLVLLAKAYGSHPGSPKWNPNADIDNNGVVGLSDLVLLAQHYGQKM